ncbi:tetratricopeptide repeat protein [Actinosynnema sp. NPDC051121]
MPSGVEAQAALYRSLLVDRRVLIVLDNANSADQVRPLLPGSPGCVVVVTSRDRLTGLVITEGASRLTLDLLTAPEAIELVRSILGSDRADVAAVHELVQRCARLPLALRIAATRAAQPHTTVEEVVVELADEAGPLEALSREGDERAAVRAVFEWSYRLLDDDQARMFRLLSLHLGPDFSFHAAAVVAEVELRVARMLLDHLVRVHLLEPAMESRYRFHDLLRAYAGELVERYEGQGDRDSARRALLGWYTSTTHACNVVAYPAHPRLSRMLPSAPDYRISIADWSEAKEWLRCERDSLIANLRYVAHRQLYDHAFHLADGMTFLAWLGNRDDLLDTYTVGLIAARQCGDQEVEAWFRTRIGETLGYLQRWDEALAEFHLSLAVARDLGSRYLQAQILGDIGWVLVEQRQFQVALPYLEEGVILAEGVDGGRLQGVMAGNLSRVYTGSHQYRKALEHGERELQLRLNSGDFPSEPIALHHIAQARQGLGDHPATIALCRDAIRLGHLFGDVLVTVAEPLETIAVSLHHVGQVSESLTCWQEAAAIYERYGQLDKASQIRERIRDVG